MSGSATRVRISIGIAMAVLAGVATPRALVAQTVTVTTPRGAELSVSVSAPANLQGRGPAVVIAPSPNLTLELEDLQAVLRFTRADPRVDASRIVIVGKSLGSLVAERAFVEDPDAQALVLLTPVCSVAAVGGSPTASAAASAVAVNYPSLATLTRPVVLIPGHADPLCAIDDLYAFLAGSSGDAAIVVVGGDHSWNVTTDSSAAGAARNTRSISEGVRIAAHWINLLLER